MLVTRRSTRIAIIIIAILYYATHYSHAHADADASAASSSSPSSSSSHDRDDWISPFTHLARTIIQLPFEPESSSVALTLIRTYRSTPNGLLTRWSHRFGRTLIPLWDRRIFPDALEQMRQRPTFRESRDALAYDQPEKNGKEEEVYDGKERPKLIRPNIIHILAGRGFEEAIKEVFSYLSPSSIRSSLSTGCIVSGTLNLDEVQPLHLLALYAPDDDDDVSEENEGHGNVGSAKLLLQNGANLTSETLPEHLHLTPIVLAAERGNLRLLNYFLTHHLPPTYFLSPTEVTRTPSEQSEYDEWFKHRTTIRERHFEEVRSGSKKHNETEYQDYLDWYERQRPKTKQEREAESFESSLFRSLQLSVVANRTSIVRRLLSGPGRGYHLLNYLNERAHGGRGDTVLHGAIRQGFEEMIELLLEYGSDIEMKSYEGKTMRELGKETNNKRIQDIIQHHIEKKMTKNKIKPSSSSTTSSTRDGSSTVSSSSPSSSSPTRRSSSSASSAGAPPRPPPPRPPRRARTLGTQRGEKRKRRTSTQKKDRYTNEHEEL